MRSKKKIRCLCDFKTKKCGYVSRGKSGWEDFSGLNPTTGCPEPETTVPPTEPPTEPQTEPPSKNFAITTKFFDPVEQNPLNQEINRYFKWPVIALFYRLLMMMKSQRVLKTVTSHGIVLRASIRGPYVQKLVTRVLRSRVQITKEIADVREKTANGRKKLLLVCRKVCRKICLYSIYIWYIFKPNLSLSCSR